MGGCQGALYSLKKSVSGASERIIIAMGAAKPAKSPATVMVTKFSTYLGDLCSPYPVEWVLEFLEFVMLGMHPQCL
uniref:Uncharacterized protein n=1 Tax=Ascaris lumbricoides TaxID=6252 RepID=A0A0M3IXQ7_ASCLU